MLHVGPRKELIRASLALPNCSREPHTFLKTSSSVLGQLPVVTLVLLGLLELDTWPSNSFPDFDYSPQMVEDLLILAREIIGKKELLWLGH